MHSNEHIGRKMRRGKLQDEAAIVLAAFGSSRRGKAVLEGFDELVRGHFSSQKVYWGYTSEIIRKKTGDNSLQQTLAQVESDGFRKAVVIPLQIFPGVEYREIAQVSQAFPGLRVIMGETLMHRWEFVKEVLEVVAKDFLSGDDGLNLLALHGTPLTGDPVNGAYLGVERYVADGFENVLAASLEGVPDHQAVLNKINRDDLVARFRRVRILPLMFVAGLHVEDDLMGEDHSWKSALEKMGFVVECQEFTYKGETYYKSLGANSEIQQIFLRRIERALDLIKYY